MPSSSTPREPELELDAVVELSSEQREVLRWRVEELERAGYPTRQAWQLARTSVDLHAAVRILRAGCDPELAVQILT